VHLPERLIKSVQRQPSYFDKLDHDFFGYFYGKLVFLLHDAYLLGKPPLWKKAF
jgi:hypothetical protein